MTTTRFDVPEIHCDHCKTSLEGALGPVEGVSSVVVDVPGRTVIVQHDPEITSADRLTHVIEDQAYDVTDSAEVG